MSSITFVGIALELESVTQTGLATVQVRFTQDPLAVSATGAHDALNPANYTLTGPGTAVIRSCGIVVGDTQSINLFLAGPLAVGNWVLSVVNVQTATGATLQSPTSMAFNVTTAGFIQNVNPGAVSDSEEDIIRKHLNPALQGKGWNALIAAVATGEQTNRNNARLAFDQMFTSTASGLYLERRAADNGIQRPDSMGLSDQLFRQYAIRVTNNKLTEESFLEVLQTFYGDSSVRASNSTAQIEPYAMIDGADLYILVDENTTVPVVFASADFAILGAATALEVAAAITRACRNASSTAYAAPTTDPITGLSTVTIYSGSLGLGSSVRVTGGRAQNILQFSTPLSVYGAFSSFSWTITQNNATGTTRFSTTSSVVDLTKVQPGDYVNIYGNEFATVNQGSLQVTNVSVSYPGGVLTQYFDVTNRTGGSQNVTQLATSSMMFFRPTKQTIHAAADRAVSVASMPGSAAVTLPATSQAVSREMPYAAYGIVNPSIAVSSLVRSAGTVTATATNHGLTAGQWLYIDGAAGSVTPPTVTAGNGTTTTSYAATTVASASATTAGADRIWNSLVTLADGRVLSIGGAAPGSAATSTGCALLTFTGNTPHAPNGTQYTITNVVDTALPQAIGFAAAVLMTDASAGNKVIVSGGTANGMTALGAFSTGVYLYTPGAIGSLGGWTSTTAMLDTRAGHTMIQLTNGKVLVVGGIASGGGCWATMELFTPSTKVWAHTSGNLNTGRCQPGVIQLKNSDVLITGGRTSTQTKLDYTTPSDVGTLTNTVEVLSNSTLTSSYVGSMSYARVGHQSFLLDDGRVIVIGGLGYNPIQSTTPVYLNSTEIYDPNLKTWAPGPSMRIARAFFAAGRIGSRIYVMGGSETSTIIEYLDLTTMTWNTSPATMPQGPTVKIAGTVNTMQGGTFLVASGGAQGGNFSAAYDWTILTPNNETWRSGSLNGLVKVASIIDANTFTYLTNDQTYTASGSCTATPVTAQASTITGPFSYDSTGGVAVTGSKSTLTAAITKGLQYSAITVTDATQFPDAPGWLCFAFGYNNQVAPVRYFGRLSSTQLAIDYNFVWPQSIGTGMEVTWLEQKGPWVPAQPTQVGSFYVTDSSAGRIAASSTITSIAAAGVTVNINVSYPGDFGLGNWGYPESGNYKVSDEVAVWGSNEVDTDLANARGD